MFPQTRTQKEREREREKKKKEEDRRRHLNRRKSSQVVVFTSRDRWEIRMTHLDEDVYNVTTRRDEDTKDSWREENIRFFYYSSDSDTQTLNTTFFFPFFFLLSPPLFCLSCVGSALLSLRFPHKKDVSLCDGQTTREKTTTPTTRKRKPGKDERKEGRRSSRL